MECFLIILPKGSMYNVNKIGPSTEPCGTPRWHNVTRQGWNTHVALVSRYITTLETTSNLRHSQSHLSQLTRGDEGGGPRRPWRLLSRGETRKMNIRMARRLLYKVHDNDPEAVRCVFRRVFSVGRVHCARQFIFFLSDQKHLFATCVRHTKNLTWRLVWTH